jgi:hypothetical protein
MKPEVKTKLNFRVILNPVPSGRDVITGTLPGADRLEIKITRRFDGWTPLLRITVAGHTVHAGEASKADQEQFDELENRARDYNAREKHSEHALQTAKAAQLWTEYLS